MCQNFIFDKDGNLLFHEEGKGAIQIGDENNFFINKMEGQYLTSYHYRFNGECFELFNLFENVFPRFIDNVKFSFDFFCFGDSLLTYPMKDGKKVLYNFKTGNVVVDDYDSAYMDLRNFYLLIGDARLDARRVRFVKKVRCANEIRKLEFLIDQDGKADNVGVHDFKNGQVYQIWNRKEESQIEVLNSIYEKVKLELEEEVKSRQNSEKFGKCRTLKKD